MSWQEYVNNLLAGQNVEKAAIIGLEGNVWATSPDFNLAPAEISAILGSFTNAAGVMAAGVKAAGIKYFYLQSDEKQLQAKKGACGICVAKSSRCIVVGVYGNNMQAGNCRTSVEGIVDYLILSGY